MNWNYGFRVAEGQVKETRAQEAQTSLNLVEGSDLHKQIKAVTEAAFTAVEQLLLDDAKPYQIVMQGSRQDTHLAVQISIIAEG
jgi:hypothetical protein